MSAIRLIFNRPRSNLPGNRIHLRFGEQVQRVEPAGSRVCAGPELGLTVDMAADGVRLPAGPEQRWLWSDIAQAGERQIPGGAPLVQDINAHTYIGQAIAVATGPAHALAAPLAAPWRDAYPIAARAAIRHADAYALSASARAAWLDALPERAGFAIRHAEASRLDAAGGCFWQSAQRIERAAWSAWREAHTLSLAGGIAWYTAQPVERPTRARWDEARALARPLWARTRDAYALGALVVISWIDARAPDWGRPSASPPPPPPPPPAIGPLRLIFRIPAGQFGARLVFGARVSYPGDAIIPVRRVYYIMHDIQLMRAADNLKIKSSALRLSVDLATWCWRFQATIHGQESLSAVQPDADGHPCILRSTINGHDWLLMVEQPPRRRDWPGTSVQISGRSLQAALDAPYVDQAEGVNASLLSVRQLAESFLPAVDWSLAWDAGAADWNVPAGAFAWRGVTPALALFGIPRAVGHIVAPHPSAQAWRVRPRFKAPPWDYASAAPDLVIPPTARIAAAHRAKTLRQYNAAFVHGDATGGVFTRVLRTGEAGDRLAPTASHALITDAAAARALGTAILGEAWMSDALGSATIGLGGDFPLATLGDLVQCGDDFGTVSGIDIAVNVDQGGAAQVRQTLDFGARPSNLVTALRAATPSAPTLWARVEAINADGTATVSYPRGGTARVKLGAMTPQPSDAIFERGGFVIASAPNFGAAQEIEV
jgi:hypothetical protein